MNLLYIIGISGLIIGSLVIVTLLLSNKKEVDNPNNEINNLSYPVHIKFASILYLIIWIGACLPLGWLWLLMFIPYFIVFIISIFLIIKIRSFPTKWNLILILILLFLLLCTKIFFVDWGDWSSNFPLCTLLYDFDNPKCLPYKNIASFLSFISLIVYIYLLIKAFFIISKNK